MSKEIENKIGQLQYEINCLGLDKEDLTGVSIRTEELKDLVKKLALNAVVVSEAELCEYCEQNNIDTNTDYCKECIDHVMQGGR